MAELEFEPSTLAYDATHLDHSATCNVTTSEEKAYLIE